MNRKNLNNTYDMIRLAELDLIDRLENNLKKYPRKSDYIIDSFDHNKSELGRIWGNLEDKFSDDFNDEFEKFRKNNTEKYKLKSMNFALYFYPDGIHAECQEITTEDAIELANKIIEKYGE